MENGKGRMENGAFGQMPGVCRIAKWSGHEIADKGKGG